MIGLIISFIQSIFVTESNNPERITNDDETARIKDMRYRIHHEIIQKKINKSILNGYVTRYMPEFEEDEHWAVELSRGEPQLQAINCRVCGEYKYPFCNDNEKIQCQCVNYESYDVYGNNIYDDKSIDKKIEII